MAHLLLDKKTIRDIEHEANMLITDDDGDSGAITIQRLKPNMAYIYGKSYFCLFDLILPQDKGILEREVTEMLDNTGPNIIDFEIDDGLAGQFSADLRNTTTEKVRECAMQMVDAINYWTTIINKYGELAKSHYENREEELRKKL